MPIFALTKNNYFDFDREYSLIIHLLVIHICNLNDFTFIYFRIHSCKDFRSSAISGNCLIPTYATPFFLWTCIRGVSCLQLLHFVLNILLCIIEWELLLSIIKKNQLRTCRIPLCVCIFHGIQNSTWSIPRTQSPGYWSITLVHGLKWVANLNETNSPVFKWNQVAREL